MAADGSMFAPLKILIVEDEILLAMDLEAHLEALGQDVVGVASDAAEAFDFAGSEAPDLALVDVNLRDGPSGPRIASELAQRHDTIVVFVTGSPDQIPSDYAGAVGAVLKPWDPITIEQLIAFVCAYSEADTGLHSLVPPPRLNIAPMFEAVLSNRAPVHHP